MYLLVSMSATRKVVHVSLPLGEHEALAARAGREGRTVSGMVLRLVRLGLEATPPASVVDRLRGPRVPVAGAVEEPTLEPVE